MNLLEKKEFYNKNKNKISKETIEKVNNDFDINFTYNSIALEGNSLTLTEVKNIIESLNIYQSKEI